MTSPVEKWKAEKHGLDAWDDLVRFAEAKTRMSDIDAPDLERMKWHGVFYRKRDGEGTYMLRIRLPGAQLSASQAKAIAYVAYEFGYGIIDVTTRANVQVQGLAIENVPKALDRLQSVGLTAKQTGHDNVRNVFGHPFSGLEPDELIDTRNLCEDITSLILDSHEYSDLPRKFNIAVSGAATHSAHFWTQDLAFLATKLRDGAVLFHVLLGGRQGQNPRLGQPLPALVHPDEVVPVTQAILDLFRRHGSREKRDRARFGYLLDDIGIGGVLSYLEDRLEFRLRPCVAEPAPPIAYDELVGWFRQKRPDQWILGLCVPLGRLTWRQLEGIAVAAAKWGDGSLRTTCEQGLAIVNIPAGFRDALATDAAALGLSPHADSITRNMVACTGKQFCNIAVTETKGHAFQLIEALRTKHLALHGIRIHMSGCPSACAQNHTADIGLKGVRVKRLLGTREGFDVFLGGGLAGQIHLAIPYRLGVDVDQLPRVIEEVVGEFYLRHQPGQTFSAYWRERLRDEEAKKTGDKDYALPTWVCEGCDHHHIGEDPPVYCPKCAGLRRLFARLDPEVEATKQSPVAAVRPDGFVAVAKLDDLAEGAGRAVQVQGTEVALFRVDGELCAIDGVCPHAGASLGEGRCSNGVVTCPAHGWTFNVRDGSSVHPPNRDVRAHEVKVEDGMVLIKLAQEEPVVQGAAP